VKTLNLLANVLQEGADPFTANRLGLNTFEEALLEGHEHIANMLKEVARRLKNWHSARRLADRIGITICEHCYDRTKCTICADTATTSEGTDLLVADGENGNHLEYSSRSKYYFFSPFELLSSFLSDKYILDDNINLELRQRHPVVKSPEADDDSTEASETSASPSPSASASASEKEASFGFLVNLPLPPAEFITAVAP
jgi:hypothetical protein